MALLWREVAKQGVPGEGGKMKKMGGTLITKMVWERITYRNGKGQEEESEVRGQNEEDKEEGG